MRRALALILLLLPLVAAAQSSVWQVETPRGALYLAGSIHVLRQSDYPLPPEFEAAWRGSEVLVLEMDLATATDAAAQQMLLSRGLYGGKETIREHLSPEVYARLADYCRKRQVPLATLERFRPWMLVMTLTMAEMQAEGFEPDAGVDAHFYARARQEGRAVHGLETLADQVEALAGFDQQGDPLVANFLEESAALPELMADMVGAWRTGDSEQLAELVARDMREGYPSLYDALLVKRNRRWLPVLDEWARSGKRVMVVVGSAHLVGEEGLVAMLRQRGYRVVPLALGAP